LGIFSFGDEPKWGNAIGGKTYSLKNPEKG
jgi:hypothetical protein